MIAVLVTRTIGQEHWQTNPITDGRSLMSNATQPSPKFFFQTINAYQRPAALKAAIELALFTAIDQGARTAGELAIRCEASRASAH